MDPKKDCCTSRHRTLFDQGQKVGIKDSSQPMWSEFWQGLAATGREVAWQEPIASGTPAVTASSKGDAAWFAGVMKALDKVSKPRTVRDSWEQVKPGEIVEFTDGRQALKLEGGDQVADLADGAVIWITDLLLMFEEYDGQFFTLNKCHECGR